MRNLRNRMGGIDLYCYLACCFIALAIAAPLLNAQAPAPKTSKSAKPAPSKKGPLTKAEVQKLWADKNESLLINEINLRHLSFEPTESWIAQLPKLTGVERSSMPGAAAALDKLLPPLLDPEEVAKDAPPILTKLKEAVQKRSEGEMAPLVHPELLASVAKIYDLFDTTNYRAHTLGRYAAMENRQVGVQFFQLTKSQVERLDYVTFSSYRGKTVVRDIVSGSEAVAALFLRDEVQMAKSKLDLVFRALNDGDDTPLKNLCTPGLYDSLKVRTGDKGGNLLTRGQHVNLAKGVSVVPTVPLNQKSVRVVVRVGYPVSNGSPLQYDIDFERVDKDLKVVRVRDLKGGVIAWDPDIDNFLNRRYGLADDAPVKTVAESDDPNFYSLPVLRAKAARAIENRDLKKLQEVADQFIQRLPSGGDAYSVQATLEHTQGKYDEATIHAAKAIDLDGTVCFDVLQSGGIMSHTLSPLIVAVSKSRVELRPVGGGPSEIIPNELIKMSFDRLQSNSFKSKLKELLDQPGPYLKIDVARQKNKTYKFAAVGTQCPDASTARRTDLEQYPGSGCGTEGTPQNPKPVHMLVPHEWYQDMKVVMDTIEHAKQAGDGLQTKR